MGIFSKKKRGAEGDSRPVKASRRVRPLPRVRQDVSGKPARNSDCADCGNPDYPDCLDICPYLFDDDD